MQQIGKIRGIKNLEEFLDPPISSLNSPYLLLNIEAVAKKIIRAILDKKRICISMDCDVDGIMSTVIMYQYLRQLTNNIYIIYAQRSEGHGIEYQLDKVEEDTDLLIILDSSTNSTDACKTLSEKGIDIVILDHHAVEKDNPYATIVNPQLDFYPNKEISGATLAYKMIQVLDDTFGTGAPEEYLDLVACGMYADMMSVAVPENRYLIISGMKNITNTGLKVLLSLNKIHLAQVTCQTLGYTISPRLNGVARLDKIELALELLLAPTAAIALEVAQDIEKLNVERKALARDIYNNYEQSLNLEEKIIIVVDDHASKGFNGVIANELAETYKRPAIVLRRTNGILTGSFRSYAGFKLKTFLNKFRNLNYAAGHEEAGGIELKEFHLDLLKEFIERQFKLSDSSQAIQYDIELFGYQINESIIELVQQFDYLSGKDMPAATFKIKNLFVETRNVIGKNKDTVKIECDGLCCVKFKTKANWANEIGSFDTINALGQLSINVWVAGRKLIKTNQLVLEGYKKVV